MEVPSRTYTRLASKILVELIRLFATHMRLLEHRKIYSIIHIAHVRNLYFRAWILACKIVRWESQDNKSRFIKLVIKLIEPRELRRIATPARRVNNQSYDAFVLFR